MMQPMWCGSCDYAQDDVVGVLQCAGRRVKVTRVVTMLDYE